MKYAAFLLLGTLCLAETAMAEDYVPPVVGGRTYIQHQAEAAKQRHREIQSVRITGVRDQTSDYVVLALTDGARSVFSKVPQAAPDGSESSRDGRFLTVREALLSSTNHRLGTIEIRFAKRRGQSAAALSGIARDVQSRIARATLSARNAIDPYPYDANYGPGTYAQALTERLTRTHPDLLVVMLHATRPGGDTHKENVVIGSNIGRLGKLADEDDLRVIEQGSTNLEVGGDNDRFETELPLLDASGTRIGALGLVFNFRQGQDREAIHAHGRAIRDELARLIPNATALFAPR